MVITYSYLLLVRNEQPHSYNSTSRTASRLVDLDSSRPAWASLRARSIAIHDRYTTGRYNNVKESDIPAANFTSTLQMYSIRTSGEFEVNFRHPIEYQLHDRSHV